VPPLVLFGIGMQIRRMRLALPEKTSLAPICRTLDFLCCSLAPKCVLRRVPCGTGFCMFWIRVNDPSHYDLARGFYEPTMIAWLNENTKLGDTFLDIGANVGYYAVLAAKLVGPTGLVIAVEADPNIAEILRKNLEANHLSNARVISGAATDFAGTVRVGRAPASGWTGLYYATPEEWIDVPAFTVDGLSRSLGLNQVNVVKVDVEGAEASVLDGMTDVLKRFTPRLLIEVHRTHSGVEEHVLKILAAHSFETEILDSVDATMHVAATPTLKSAIGERESAQ